MNQTSTQTQEATPAERLIPLTDWPKWHPWPTVSGLRMMVIRVATNGADVWLRRVGKRILIREAAFFRWVESQNPATPSSEGAHRG